MTKITETKNPQSNNLDNMSISKIIELMNIEDKEQEIAERIIENPLLASMVEGL